MLLIEIYAMFHKFNFKFVAGFPIVDDCFLAAYLLEGIKESHRIRINKTSFYI